MGTILLLTMGIEKSSGKIEVLEALCFKDFLAEWVGFEPTYRLLTDNSISSRARYGHFATPPQG